jgi:hypothetical protein
MKKYLDPDVLMATYDPNGDGPRRVPRSTPVEFVPLREFAAFADSYRLFARVVVALLVLQIVLSGVGVCLAIW